MTRRSLESLGELQKAVMETVWKLQEATVAQVRDELEWRKPLAYTTVLSVMQKLEKAGWLGHRVDGRTYVYQPARSRQEAGQKTVRKLVEGVFGGDRMLLFEHLLEDQNVTAEELAKLRAMIELRRKELQKQEQSTRKSKPTGKETGDD